MFIKRKHTRKPSFGFELDKSNTIAKKIDLYSPLADAPARDFEGKLLPTVSGTSLTASALGRVTEFTDGDYINFGDVHDLGSYSIFFGCWFKTIDTSYAIINKSIYASAKGRYFLYSDAGNITFGAELNFGLRTVVVTDNYNDGNWHYIVGVIDRLKEVRLYIDGVKVGTTTATDPYDYNTTNILLLGRYNDTAGTGVHATFAKFTGEMSDFILGHNSLNDVEAKLLYDNFYQILKPRSIYISEIGFKPYWANNATVVQPMQGMS